MSLSTSDSTPWGLIQWGITGLATAFTSAIALVWRLANKLDTLEGDLGSHKKTCESNATSTEAAMIRLTDKLQQIHDDHFRIRESLGALPSRTELRDVEDRIAEQLANLANRLDRSLDRRDG